MGRKTNPNSFNSLKKIPQLWSFLRSVEYSYLVRKNILLTEIIKHFFEKKGFIIKSCFLIIHKESKTASLFLSFYILQSKIKQKKRGRKRKTKKTKVKGINLFFLTKFKGLKKFFNNSKANQEKAQVLTRLFLKKKLKKKQFKNTNTYYSKLNNLRQALLDKILLSKKTGIRKFYLLKEKTSLFKKQVFSLFSSGLKKKKKYIFRRFSICPQHFFFFFSFFKLLGFFSFNRVIFRNLESSVKKTKKEVLKNSSVPIGLLPFKKQFFFKDGLFIYYLLLTNLSGVSFILANYIKRVFRMLHRTKKINRFLFFIRNLVENVILHDRFFGQGCLGGIKILIKGRFRGASRTKKRWISAGNMPLQTIDSFISYDSQYIFTSYGVFCVKVWVFEKNIS